MRQRSRIAVFLLASLLWVAGCAGEPESGDPETSPPAPTTGAPSPETPDPAVSEPEDGTPTPEPLPLPEYPQDLTNEDTAENAVLAAEYFIELMNYIQSTGDVGPFEEVAAPSCASCERYVARVVQLYGHGGFSVGNYTSLENVIAARTKDGIAWEVTSDWRIDEGFRYDTTQDSTHELDETLLPGRRIGVQLHEGQWWILALAREAP